jgi:hypothetical protein
MQARRIRLRRNFPLIARMTPTVRLRMRGMAGDVDQCDCQDRMKAKRKQQFGLQISC